MSKANFSVSLGTTGESRERVRLSVGVVVFPSWNYRILLGIGFVFR